MKYLFNTRERRFRTYRIIPPVIIWISSVAARAIVFSEAQALHPGAFTWYIWIACNALLSACVGWLAKDIWDNRKN